ncbi:glycosyltransferase [Mesorhizobium sp. M4B.F.Ca.ET.013.02.1.1]|uniref:glycosyltransferase family 32 protein n=1 Tax=Mesorhizobium sp. M4B.F.Ca.ET.013.02.1.1 TaxID=2496755 RepID=UPI001FDF8A65|nr:glycosyltransferase [Mesorhizobium sp. M4B.F.Ca.ET.013.02.1.1]
MDRTEPANDDNSVSNVPPDEPPMIPKILHQTWKTDSIPARFQAYVESWKRLHPGWTVMFWNDRMLLEFVARHYPDFLPTFCSYSQGVLRADAGRYLLLHHFGGVYADIDCECVAPFDLLTGEDRIVVCREPDTHARVQAGFRGLPYLLFNGTIASPPGHPFWLHLLSFLPGLAHAKEAIDATGPSVMTSRSIGVRHPSFGAVRAGGLVGVQRRRRRADAVHSPLGGHMVDAHAGAAMAGQGPHSGLPVLAPTDPWRLSG